MIFSWTFLRRIGLCTFWKFANERREIQPFFVSACSAWQRYQIGICKNVLHFHTWRTRFTVVQRHLVLPKNVRCGSVRLQRVRVSPETFNLLRHCRHCFVMAVHFNGALVVFAFQILKGDSLVTLLSAGYHWSYLSNKFLRSVRSICFQDIFIQWYNFQELHFFFLVIKGFQLSSSAVYHQQ